MTLSLLSVPGEDVWSYAKKLPHLFQQGGVFYNIVKKDMGTFVCSKHLVSIMAVTDLPHINTFLL